MGSFWGHADEGIFFTLMSLWWMMNVFKDYILAEALGQEVRPKLSYSVTIGKRSIPVETVLFKILFPLAAFMAEFFDGGIQFTDKNGDFAKLVYQQHMTMYGNFLIHGVVDLMHHMGKPIYPGMHYITGVTTFVWFGVGMFQHASMHGREPVDHVLHVLVIFPTSVLCLAVLFEIWWQKGVWTQVVRSFCLLTTGTWFFHMAFMLYTHDSFPRSHASGLDLMAPRNVTYVKAMFGLHIFINLAVMMAVYVITYCVLRLIYGIKLEPMSLRESYDQACYRPLPISAEKLESQSRRRQTIADSCVDHDDHDNDVTSPLYSI